MALCPRSNNTNSKEKTSIMETFKGGRSVIQQTLHVMIRIADHDISLHHLFAKKLANKTSWRFLGLQMFDVLTQHTFPHLPGEAPQPEHPEAITGTGTSWGGAWRSTENSESGKQIVTYCSLHTELLYVLLDVILSYAAVLSVTIVFVLTCGYYMLTMVPTANMIAVVIP